MRRASPSGRGSGGGGRGGGGGGDDDDDDAYDFFRACVKSTMRAGLDAMVREGCDVAVLARLSCGIYAGPHRRRIDEDFLSVVNELLREPVASGVGVVVVRGQYFRKVVVPLLPGDKRAAAHARGGTE